MEAQAPGRKPAELYLLCVNTIHTLSMDAMQAANSGHPGTPMAMAPVAYLRRRSSASRRERMDTAKRERISAKARG
jgi:transketolase